MNWLIQENLFPACLNWSQYWLLLACQVVQIKLLRFDEEDRATNTIGCMAFPLKLENIHSIVIACCEIVKSRVTIHDPVAVGILAFLSNLNTALHIPEAHSAVFWIWEKDLHTWMEHHTWDVASVTLKGVHLPMLVTWESPKLDCFVISCRSKYLHGWMEGNPIYSFLMAF